MGFSKSSVGEFHQTVLKYADEQCSRIVYAMEDTGIYYRGFYSFLSTLLQKQESVVVLKPSYVSHWCSLHERSKSDPLDAQSIAQIVAYERDFKTVDPSLPMKKGNTAHLELKLVDTSRSERWIPRNPHD